MNPRTKILLSTAIGALLGGTGTFTLTTDKGSTDYEAVADVSPEAVELKTRDADTLKAEITSAEAQGPVSCSLRTLHRPVGKNAAGEWVTEPFESCYCSDGQRAAWSTAASECKAEVVISDGKVYVRDAPALIDAEGGTRERQR